MNIATILGSSRRDGNTEELAQIVTVGLPSQTIDLKELQIDPFQDFRHTEEGFQLAEDDYNHIVQAFMQNDVLIFATPLYWYGMSGLMKAMFDRLSQALRDERYGSQLKARMSSVEAIVLIVGGDNPKQKALPLIQQFQHAFDFLRIKSFTDYIIGEAVRPGEINHDLMAMAQAKTLNQTLKKRI